MSLNRTVLVGRLTRDPELRYTSSGTAMARFTLAVNRQFKKDGQDEADFISCVCFNKTAENLANYQKKGSLIGVDGRIQTGKFTKDDGTTVFTTDVVADSIQFLEPKKDGQQQQPQQQTQSQQMNQPVYHPDYQTQQPPQAPPGYTQQQNFRHQAPQYGQTPQQGQVNYQTPQQPMYNDNDAPPF